MDWKIRLFKFNRANEKSAGYAGEFDIKAAFFVVADVVDHYPGLVESIVERGHEIGCHGLHHACKIDPKTKEPLMSVKGDESYDAPSEEVASGKRNVSGEVRWRR